MVRNVTGGDNPNRKLCSPHEHCSLTLEMNSIDISFTNNKEWEIMCWLSVRAMIIYQQYMSTHQLVLVVPTPVAAISGMSHSS